MELVRGFNVSHHESSVGAKFKDRCRTLAFWAPVDVASKYAELQERSGGEFGKLLKEAIIEGIREAKL